MKDGEIVASHVIFAKPEPGESARRGDGHAPLKRPGCLCKDIAYCVGTGYGRDSIPFADAWSPRSYATARVPSGSCPEVHMVIDIGGQDAKAIRLDGCGNVIRFAYNDRCASGTGRFLEVMAGAMGIRLEDMGEISAPVDKPSLHLQPVRGLCRDRDHLAHQCREQPPGHRGRAAQVPGPPGGSARQGHRARSARSP